MIKGIIFDMDGVLVDSERQSDEGWKWAAGQLGIEMPKQLIDSFKGASAELCRKRFDDYFHGKADYLEAKSSVHSMCMICVSRRGFLLKRELAKCLNI